jgi:hypothetical protein
VKKISDFIGVYPVDWSNTVWKKGLTDAEIDALRNAGNISKYRNVPQRAMVQKVKERKK